MSFMPRRLLWKPSERARDGEFRRHMYVATSHPFGNMYTDLCCHVQVLGYAWLEDVDRRVLDELHAAEVVVETI
jgi:hypothetical protein